MGVAGGRDGAFPAAIRVGANCAAIARSRGGWGSGPGWRTKFRREWQREGEVVLLRCDVLPRGPRAGQSCAALSERLRRRPHPHPHNTKPGPAPPAWSRVQPANQAAGPWPCSAIWGGRCTAALIGRVAAERLPEIDLRALPLSAPACNGGPRVHDMGLCRRMQHQISASMDHCGLGSHSQRRDTHGDCSNQHTTFTRHTHPTRRDFSLQPRHLTGACQQSLAGSICTL